MYFVEAALGRSLGHDRLGYGDGIGRRLVLVQAGVGPPRPGVRVSPAPGPGERPVLTTPAGQYSRHSEDKLTDSHGLDVGGFLGVHG